MNKLKNTIILLLLGSIFLFASGCNQPEDNSNSNKSDNKSDVHKYVDTLGREVEIANPPQKVISLSPAITEMLFALDLGDTIVGTTDFCDYPEEAKDKPKIGNFENPNLELIVSSEPDLVFVAAGIQMDLIDKFEELGLKVFCLDAETIEQVISNIELAGQIMNVEPKAQEITEKMETQVAAIKKKAEGQAKPLVFFEIWDSPLMSAGPGTFIHDMINLAGGINFAETAQTRYPQVNFETLVEKDPDVYITIAHQKQDQITDRPNYDSLKAIKNGRIYSIEDDLVTLPGPRIVEGLEEIAKAIHPEIFD